MYSMDRQDYSQLAVSEVLQTLGTGEKGLSPAQAQHLQKQLAPSKLYPSAGGWLDIAARHMYKDSFLVILVLGLLCAWGAGAGTLVWLLGAVLVWQLLVSVRSLLTSRRFLLYVEQGLQTAAVALRGGHRLHIDAHELVPGDMVILEKGVVVPADIRLVSASGLTVDERALPGGLNRIKKSAKTGANNIALFGTQVLSGEAAGVVIACGKNTVLGTHAGFTRHLNHHAANAADPGAPVRRATAWLGLVAGTALIVYAWAEHVPFAEFCLLLATLAVAVVPVTLPGLLAFGKNTAKSGNSMLHYTQNDAGAKTALAVFSIIGQVSFQVPLAISALLLLAFDVLIQLFPLLVLRRQDMRQNRYQEPGAISLSFSLFAAALVYLNYLFFFARRGISPVNIDNHSHLYFSAITLSWLTLGLCRLINLLFTAGDEATRPAGNRRLLLALAVSLFCILNVAYNPWLQSHLHTGPLAAGDWLSILAASAIYLAAGLFERKGRKHTRSALLRDHSPEHIRKHLEPRGA